MGKLEGKIALITGGNSGIGLATARQFVNEGAYVFITGRRVPELAAATKGIGKNVAGVEGDVSNLGDLDRLFAQIKREANLRSSREREILLVMGDKRVGWIAADDLAAVSAQVLAEGPQKHASKQYWLSTEVMNGVEAAAEIAKGLGQPVESVVLTPDDLVAQITSCAMRLPSYVEATYGTSILEWVRQTYDGRMDFGATTTTTVEDLTGRKPLTLREWVVRYRDSALAVGAQAAEGSLKE